MMIMLMLLLTSVVLFPTCVGNVAVELLLLDLIPKAVNLEINCEVLSNYNYDYNIKILLLPSKQSSHRLAT